MRLLPLLFVAGCPSAPEVPLRIQSVNHRTPRSLEQAPIVVEPGSDLALTVEHNGGRKAEVWWGWAPPGWAFAPDSDTGVWHVPDDFQGCASVGLFVRKPHRVDPRIAELTVNFATEAWTNRCAYYPPGTWTLDRWGETLDTGWY